MLKSDLIIKLIEKFRAAEEIISNLLSEDKYEEALKYVDETYRDLFRLGSKSFNTLSDEDLIEMLKINGIIETDRFIIAARLMEREGSILERLNYPAAADHIYAKALRIYLEAFFSDPEAELKEYFKDVEIIQTKLEDYDISKITKMKLCLYFEESQNYAEAENILYDLLEAENYEKELLKSTVDFYERLLSKGDDDLIQGGLPRDEIQDALNFLLQKFSINNKIN